MSYHCISYYFNCNSQLYTSNKTECYSYKGRCGMIGTKVFEGRASFGYCTYKRFWIIRVFKTNSYTSKELMNRAVIHFQNIVCITMWFVVMCSNYFKWNLSQEQTIINLFCYVVSNCAFVFNIMYILLYCTTIMTTYVHA